MKRTYLAVLVVVFLLATACWSFAATKGTAAEAKAMVKKAVTYLKENGKEKTFAAVTDKNAMFVDRDLYVTIYDFNGVCVAHAFNSKMVGKNLLDMRDSDGKLFVQERVDMAKKKPSFWVDYKYTNPVTKKIEPKSMYHEVAGDLIVGVGIYK